MQREPWEPIEGPPQVPTKDQRHTHMTELLKNRKNNLKGLERAIFWAHTYLTTVPVPSRKNRKSQSMNTDRVLRKGE